MKRVFIILVLLVLVSGCTQVMETPTTQNQTDNNMTGETFEQAWNDTGETTVNKTEDPEEKIDISKDQNAMASLEREIDILTEGGNIIGYDHYTRMRETLDSIDINATDYDRLSAKLEPLNPEGQGSSAAKDIPDACEGAEGNGDQIVSGPSGPTDYDPDNPFRSLTVHPTNPDLIYLGTERNGFLKSTDGGETWTRMRKGLWHDDPDTVMGHEPFYPEIYDIAYSVSNPQVMYAAAVSGPGPLLSNYPGPAAGVYKSTDGGDSWEWKSCGLTSGWPWSVWAHPTNSDIALVGISGGGNTASDGGYYDGGIFRTTNGGEKWERVSLGVNDGKNAYRVIVSAKDNPDLVYTSGIDIEEGKYHIGLFKSTDSGLTWTGIDSDYFNYFDISSDGETIVGALHDDCSNLIKSADGGNTWSETAGSCYAVAVSQSNPKRILYAASDGVYMSRDGLISKTKVLSIVSDGTGKGHISDIVFAPTNSSIVYVITSGYNFYKSTDSGETFENMGNLRTDVLNMIS